MQKQTKLNLLLGLFVTLLVLMNLLGSKLTTIFGVSVSVAIFMTPLTFLITDIVGEVEGKKAAKEFVWIGFVMLLVTLGFTLFSVGVSPAARFLELNDSYTKIFEISARFTFASMIAFLVSQLHDVWSFDVIKTSTKGRFLWLRNNVSTMLSQAIDTLLFMFIAFYHITPAYTVGFILSLALPYYLFKIAFALLDTPLIYAGVKWLRG
jgi:uncharacterized integral membrane protein (TIGR00697 family)